MSGLEFKGSSELRELSVSELVAYAEEALLVEAERGIATAQVALSCIRPKLNEVSGVVRGAKGDLENADLPAASLTWELDQIVSALGIE